LAPAAPIETDVEPVYLSLFQSGELAERANRAYASRLLRSLRAILPRRSIRPGPLR
jgi:hypothetical protein